MRPLRRELSRLVLMVGGEGLQSGLHFALSLSLIGVMPAREYGLFAIAMVLGGVGLTYVRALTAMPAMIYVGRARSDYSRNFYEGVFAAAAVVLSGLVGGLAYLLIRAASPPDAPAGALFIGLWCARSHARAAFFARRRQYLVTASDLAFAVSGAGLALAAIQAPDGALSGVFYALAGANAVGIGALFAISRSVPRIDASRRARRFYLCLVRRLAWSAFSVTTANLQGQGVSLLVASLAGPAAYAPLAAMLVVFSPLRILASGFVNMFQPQVAQLASRRAFADIWRLCVSRSLGLGAGALVYGVAAALALPHLRSALLQGAPLAAIAVSGWLVYTQALLYTAPRVALEVMMKFRVIAILTSLGAIASLALIAALLQFGASHYALAGAALGEGAVLAASWTAARAVLVSRPGAPRNAKGRAPAFFWRTT